MSTVTPKEMEILDILASGEELYGLEVVERSDNRVKRGTVYVTMNRLEDKGLVISRRVARDAGDPGIPKRVFRITADGRRALAASEIQSRDAWEVAT